MKKKLTDIFPRRKQAQNRGVTIPNRNISGAGFSFALDKILSALTLCHADDSAATDVVVCVCGTHTNLREVTQIVRAFWSAGIQCAIVESNGPEEGQDMAKDLGAIYYVIYGSDGSLRLRSWINEKYEERLLNRDELINFIKGKLRPEISAEMSSSQIQSTTSEASTKLGRTTILSGPTLPNVDISFITLEKMTSSARRRFENVITQNMSTSLVLFNKKEAISIVAVELPSNVMRAVSGAVDPRCINNKEINTELSYVIERFPNHKRYIKDIVEEIMDIYSDKKNLPIVCLYCLKDSNYRFIL